MVQDNVLTLHVSEPTRATSVLDIVLSSQKECVDNVVIQEPFRRYHVFSEQLVLCYRQFSFACSYMLVVIEIKIIVNYMFHVCLVYCRHTTIKAHT